MHKTEFVKSFLKDLKKLPKEIQKEVLNKWIPQIAESPQKSGSRFKGKSLRKFYKLAFRHKKNDYRMVYQIKNKQITVILLAIGSRENFYKKFRQEHN